MADTPPSSRSPEDWEKWAMEEMKYLDDHPSPEWIADLVRQATEGERDRCLDLIRHYLLFNSQRAVSFHEVNDVRDAIRNGEVAPKERWNR